MLVECATELSKGATMGAVFATDTRDPELEIKRATTLDLLSRLIISMVVQGMIKNSTKASFMNRRRGCKLGHSFATRTIKLGFYSDRFE